ncbi:hypothetical protein [Streptomyces sp. RKAG337]|uniref:hypothetical protein n=1 Tax=Streptomyces sp. RKAG337 TaxID=2893404 RepID=UPI002033D809|nr:hypothetical protein [Streptomyces sp. RKAG337]MCM2430049.1 hypothetical protein [Streptomyces sp. RKAG337]
MGQDGEATEEAPDPHADALALPVDLEGHVVGLVADPLGEQVDTQLRRGPADDPGDESGQLDHCLHGGAERLDDRGDARYEALEQRRDQLGQQTEAERKNESENSADDFGQTRRIGRRLLFGQDGLDGPAVVVDGIADGPARCPGRKEDVVVDGDNAFTGGESGVPGPRDSFDRRIQDGGLVLNRLAHVDPGIAQGEDVAGTEIRGIGSVHLLPPSG